MRILGWPRPKTVDPRYVGVRFIQEGGLIGDKSLYPVHFKKS